MKEEFNRGKNRNSRQENLKERFPVHMTITREHNTVDEYRETLEKTGYVINRSADSALESVGKVPEDVGEKLTLVKVTSEDFGLESVTAYEMLRAAKERGLMPLPPWAALQYRIDCDDNENVSIGMEPIAVKPEGARSIFHIRSYKGARTLAAGDAGDPWTSVNEWVFAVRE